jgi:hypothetical protein
VRKKREGERECVTKKREGEKEISRKIEKKFDR